MQIPDSQYITWDEDSEGELNYLVPGDTFEEWRLKTNGLKVLMDDTKVDKGGDTMDGPLVIIDDSQERTNNYIQFPDGTQQFTAAQRQLLPRAWVNFNGFLNNTAGALTLGGSALIRSSHNVSSVTKLATSGLYKINFIVPMKNTSYCVTGLSNELYANEAVAGTGVSPVALVARGGIIVPYHQETSNVKISTGNAHSATGVSSKLVNVMAYATDEPDVTYTGNTVFQFTLTQRSLNDNYYTKKYDNYTGKSTVRKYSVDSYWTLTGGITSSTISPVGNGFYFKIIDGSKWQSKKLNTIGQTVELLNGYRLRLEQSGVFNTSMDLLIVNLYNIEDQLIKTWDIQRKITVKTSNGSIATGTSNPVFSIINTINTIPDVTDFSTPTLTTVTENGVRYSRAVFSFTVNA